jgi:putative membrane protein
VTVPFDPGLQGERTALAWSRTALALALAGAVMTRMTVDRLGAVAVLLGLVAVVASVATGMLAVTRYHRSAVSLHERGSISTDGRVLALAAISVVAAGGMAALFVVWGMLDA